MLTPEQRRKADEVWNQMQGSTKAQTTPSVSTFGTTNSAPSEDPNTSWDAFNALRAKSEAQQSLIEAGKKQIEERANPSGGFFSKAANAVKDFGVGAFKSFAETGLRTQTDALKKSIDPFGVGEKVLEKATGKEIPESVNLPVLGETSIKYSEDPMKQAMQRGEDVLNALPGGAARKTAAELAEQGAKGFAGKLMKSAFKVTENDLKKNPNLVKDFLVERMSGFTKRGIAKEADKTVGGLEKQLDNVIEEASKNGKSVDATKVAEATKDLVSKYENSAFPEYAQTVKDKVAEFVKRGQIPIKEAQEFKKNTYAIIRESGYGHMLGPDKEAGKQIARGIKEGIEQAIPEFKVADINKKLAIYGKARDLMERQINKAGKNEIIGLKDIVLTGASGRIWPSLVRMVVESVPFKTFVANTLVGTKKQAVSNAIKITAPAVKELIKD